MTVPLELRNDCIPYGNKVYDATAGSGRTLTVNLEPLAQLTPEMKQRIARRISSAIAWRAAAQQLSDRELAGRLIDDVAIYTNGPEEALLAEAVDRLQGRWSKEQLIGAKV